MVDQVLNSLVSLRRSLHQHPELSGNEVRTVRRIKTFLADYSPTELLENIGGHGLVAFYDFGAPGPCILIRCELDALPIPEPNQFEHRSRIDGVAHKCGHDGHMAIVCGLAPWLSSRPFTAGKVGLLYQPAEENGQGAKAMLDDPRFTAIRPDYVFALHNMPGFPLHRVILVERQFSATVKSTAIRFSGRQSHAAEPENGLNPAWAMAEITQQLQTWIVAEPERSDFTLITPVHTTMGQPDYGISAGYGELHFTLRTWSVDNMKHLTKKLEALTDAVGEQYGLRVDRQYFDYFPATVNDATANTFIENAATAGMQLERRPLPFKFGEDFGWFTQQYRGAMFGLGAGADCPVLHNAYYDFPEALITSGIDLFKGIIRSILSR